MILAIGDIGSRTEILGPALRNLDPICVKLGLATKELGLGASDLCTRAGYLGMTARDPGMGTEVLNPTSRDSGAAFMNSSLGALGT